MGSHQGPTIRLPVHLAEKITKLRRAECRLAKATGNRPSVEDLAAELDWPIALVQRIVRVSSRRRKVCHLGAWKRD
jgi:DNA-directed RNA polymerase sigma subunit (sigma70/sigma32)